MTQCRLCCSDAKLHQSHIVPAFVFRWQKRTSSTGYLRFAGNMNQRVQDGLKTPFLCESCEAQFNEWETAFANNLFLPFHDQVKTVFPYSEWLAKFCVSVSWRTLAYVKEHGQITELAARYGTDVDHALTVWADFLLDNRPDIEGLTQHFLPLGAIDCESQPLPPNIQYYLMRAVRVDCFSNELRAYTYAKLGHFILLGMIVDSEPHLWSGTNIDLRGGTLAPTCLKSPDWVWRLLVDETNRMTECRSTLSERQHTLIAETQHKDPQRVVQSQTFLAALEDCRLGNHANTRVDETESEQ
ncbi:MAG: hypothetical protein GX621_18815 [Pirellulaceae bacterium]|nr:hypothetical protein [Pirellulaceae bacterium]